MSDRQMQEGQMNTGGDWGKWKICRGSNTWGTTLLSYMAVLNFQRMEHDVTQQVGLE
jgi:hypothetical protein